MNTQIGAALRQTLQEIAWYEGIFIDTNVWFNISLNLCIDTFMELLPDSPVCKNLQTIKNIMNSGN